MESNAYSLNRLYTPINNCVSLHNSQIGITSKLGAEIRLVGNASRQNAGVDRVHNPEFIDMSVRDRVG